MAVRPGEQLTERQLLEALLIPSGNDIAQILATQVAGSQLNFVAEMNAEARTLGMDQTAYTDPSGFDPHTISTAADQLRIFQRAMRFPIFRQIVSMPSVTLPVAGTLTNLVAGLGVPGSRTTRSMTTTAMATTTAPTTAQSARRDRQKGRCSDR